MLLALPLRVVIWIGPPAKCDRVIALAQRLAELPRVLHTSRDSNPLVAAQHDQRLKAILVRPLGVRETVLERMLRCQDRNNVLARDIPTEIDDEVPEIVFFLRADRAIGQKNERALTREAADGMIRVNPGVHAFPRFELRARRPELSAKNRSSRP